MDLYLIFNLGAPEIILIFAAILLLFGGRKIPELMRGIGKGIREFNTAKSNVKEEIDKGMKDDSTPSSGADSSSTSAESKEA